MASTEPAPAQNPGLESGSHVYNRVRMVATLEAAHTGTTLGRGPRLPEDVTVIGMSRKSRFSVQTFMTNEILLRSQGTQNLIALVPY